MTNAEAMKDLRDRRRENGLCTRCGKVVEDNRYRICSECRKYLNFYKRYEVPPAREKTLISRSPVNEIKNEKLYQAMVNKSLSTKKLSNKITATQRTVQHWLFDGTEPRKSNKIEVNSFFEKDIFEIKEVKND
jgi:RecJ-like exonuclease